VGYFVVETPGAVPMAAALDAAFASFGCETPGGPSVNGWSRMSEFQRCPYAYYLRNVLSALPPEGYQTSGPLEVGVLVHACLAVHYGRMLPPGYPGWQANLPSPDALLDAVTAANADIVFVQEARRLVEGYIDFYGFEDIEPVAVEHSAGIEGIHTCRYDLLAWKDGALWNFEHKTASNDSGAALDAWWVDGEILGEMYAWKLSQLEEVFCGRLTGVVINLLIKSKVPRFRRVEIVVPDKVLDAYARDRRWWNDHRQQCLTRGHWPRKLQGCASRFGLCAYYLHCRDEDASVLQIKERENV
jgi:hypothetical protein